MMRLLCTSAVAAICACTPQANSPLAETSPSEIARAVVDDGTYLERIDPLGGQWRVRQIGEEDLTRFKAWVTFSAGGFLNHGAGCSGGYPAFYRLDGERLTITRRVEAQIGKCGSAVPTQRTAAIGSERRLTAFLDQAATWSRLDDQTLVLAARDGTRAVLTRPIEPHPELAGRWLIESIAGKPFVTKPRQATLSISHGSIGASANCNSMGGEFTRSAPGRITVTGPLVSTAIGCPPKEAAEDALMAQAMGSVTAYRFDGDRLVLTGGPGLVLYRPSKPNRQLTGEYEACGNTLLGGYHTGPITLVIDEHTMLDNASCTASYRADGPRLTLRLEDEQACTNLEAPFVPGEPVPIGGKISTLAVAQPDGFGFDDQGRLILRTSRGLLTMCRKSSAPPSGS